MAFDGNGTFNRPVSPYVFDTVIDQDDVNTEMDGIATGLSNALTKDGQQTATANQPMGGYRHTGVGNASARTHYGVVSQIQDGDYLEVGSVSGTDTIAGSVSPAISAYAQGQTFRFIAAGTNTGATTINLNSVGAKAIQKLGAALVAGDITSGDAVEIYYDGTQFQMLTPARTPVLANGTGADASIVTGTAGTDGNLIMWNGDGDAVDSTFAPIDEDSFATNSATRLPSQQSVKAYVDTQIAAIPNITLNTTETLSGTTHTSSGIPAGTKRVTLMLDQVSLDGTDALAIQIGDSGGIETTGYVSRCSQLSGTAVDGSASSTADFVLRPSAGAASTVSGTVILTRGLSAGHQWQITGSLIRDDTAALLVFGGRKTLSGELTQLRILGSSASASFDSGTITRLDEQ